MFKILLSFFISATILFVSCSSGKLPTDSNTLELSKKELSTNSQILFLIYKLSTLDNGSFELVNYAITDGTLKQDLDETKETATPGDIIFSFQDNTGEVLKTKIVANSMKESVEYVNDKGEFERKKITHTEKDIILRTIIPADTEAIIVNQQTSDQSKRLHKIIFQ